MNKFREWAQRHARIFCLDDKTINSVLSWEGLFAAANYLPDELNDATDWIAANAAGIKPWEHLAAIQDRIKRCRAVSNEVKVDNWNCNDCHGTGRIVVPQLENVRGEDWLPRDVGAGPQYYTCAVRCHCKRGEQDFSTLPRGLKKSESMMTFATYDLANPAWRRQLADREQEQREAAALVTASDAWTKLIDRMTATMKAKRAEEAHS